MDSGYISDFWFRSVKSIRAALLNLDIDPDVAANRAYYSAFYAVSALFAVEGQYFKTHAGVQSAVHQQLVKTGRITEELGKEYDILLKLRGKADYGIDKHATLEEATMAIKAARRILRTIHDAHPDIFPLTDNDIALGTNDQ
ncbi:MAG: HEPN domain-containing protein [bacterium]